MTVRMEMEYVLPLRWSEDARAHEMAAYLERLAEWVDVTVVDGSPPGLFAVHARQWGHFVRHVAPGPWLDYANGKVNGVTTGLRIAQRELDEHDASGAPAATITPYGDGPLLVRGDFCLQDTSGELIEPGRATIALCRCGKSANKPFCDGTHKLIGFQAPSGRKDPVSSAAQTQPTTDR